MGETVQASGRVKRFLSLAAKEAHNSPMKFRHGAVLVKGGRLISKGFNHYRKTIDGASYCSTHAEMETLRKMGNHKESLQQAKGSDLFVVRMGKDGVLRRNSKPCPICVEWMHRYGVYRVYYTVGEHKNDKYVYTEDDDETDGEAGWWMQKVSDLKKDIDELRERRGYKFKDTLPLGEACADFLEDYAKEEDRSELND